MTAWSIDSIHRSLRRYLGATLDSPWELRIERREIPDEERPVAVVQLGPSSTVRARASFPQGEVERLIPVTVTAYPAVGDTVRHSRSEAEAVREQLQAWLEFGVPVISPGPGPTGLSASSSAGGALQVGVVYRYVVTAVVGGEESRVSNEVAITATSGDRSGTLDWDDVEDATAYRVYRRYGFGSLNRVASVATSTHIDDGDDTDPALHPPPVRRWGGPFRVPLWDYEGVPLEGVNRAGPVTPTDVMWIQRESVRAETIQDPQDDRRWAVALDFRVTTEAPGMAEVEGPLVTEVPGGWTGTGELDPTP